MSRLGSAAVRRDVRLIFFAQAVRALAYGFASVSLGASLASRGWSGAQVGTLLSAILLGTALASIVVGSFGDRIGRRRAYAGLFAGLAVTGLAFGLTDEFLVLVAVSLLGALSTEVVESGPFTSLEQAMLANALDGHERTRAFGTYNAVATLAGSVGALAAGGPELLRHMWSGVPENQPVLLLALVPVGLAGVLIARSLSADVETSPAADRPRRPLHRSKRTVTRLAGLFCVDAFGGGFVVQVFIAYWFKRRFGLSVEVLGMVFFAIGILQAGSFILATRLAKQIGLLNTMVFTHLPSNVLLAAIPLAPNAPVAIALLLARHALGQMDVPARQAYVAALVDPDERTAAAAYTNTARSLVRPLAAGAGGVIQQIGMGAPFVVAGVLKGMYDLALFGVFRRVPLPEGGVRR